MQNGLQEKEVLQEEGSLSIAIRCNIKFLSEPSLIKRLYRRGMMMVLTVVVMVVALMAALWGDQWMDQWVGRSQWEGE